MANIESTINMHNKDVITERKTEAVKFNCINKPGCPFCNQCQITNIIQKQKLHQNFESMMKNYATELAKVHLNSVMKTIRNHSIMKNIGRIKNFQRKTGDLKNSKQNLEYNFTF